MKTTRLNPQDYYRLPWSLTDNGISWLEITTRCNLACKGCYRDPKKEGHKSLEEIRHDLQVFKTQRKSDCMSIAGGDPLIHPQITEIIRLIKDQGWKPIINTNGLALTPAMLHDLKKAGTAGFTFHIDTTQKRKDSRASTEAGHNALRQKLADMVYQEGGMACSFNQTVSEKNLDQINAVFEWAQQNPHKVNTIVFILYREPSMVSDFAFFANGSKLDIGTAYDNTDFGGNKILKTQHMVDQIRLSDKAYQPNAYLNGTTDPQSLKWTLALRYGTTTKGFGYAGANFMKITQHFSHLFRGRWLSYSSPKILGMGRLALLAFSLFDQGTAQAGWNYLKWVAMNPLRLFRKVVMQTYAIIQPLDVMEDGQMNMCDGCPDMTVYKGKLYWSCRLEEIKENGTFVHAVPQHKLQQARALSDASIY